ncbi:uncharacterized protein A4U43_C01F24700 [Asparagus officinalis]|uniref:Uncharacterized protein n=1 Tax=Asparagus officinalis TaxID=4686 RepID=A0A5P1FW24_ASPOF|nr:uncharacterized protein A4U43_C01F24700 [Asparagus officinalis]
MASSVFSACSNSITAPNKPSSSLSAPVVSSQRNSSSHLRFSLISSSRSLRPLRAQNAENDQSTKTNSIVCRECEGNGANVRSYAVAAMELDFLVGL